jgi:hypothetical protein
MNVTKDNQIDWKVVNDFMTECKFQKENQNK